MNVKNVQKANWNKSYLFCFWLKINVYKHFYVCIYQIWKYKKSNRIYLFSDSILVHDSASFGVIGRTDTYQLGLNI